MALEDNSLEGGLSTMEVDKYHQVRENKRLLAWMPDGQLNLRQLPNFALFRSFSLLFHANAYKMNAHTYI